MTDTADHPTSPPAEPSSAQDLVARIRAEIGKAVVAQDATIRQVMIALLAGGHVLLEGVPGLGKTLIVLALARTFGGRFTRIQFTPDLMPADVTGHSIYDSKSGKFLLRRGPAFTNLLLADEINRAPAKTQAALLEVMQERQISIDGAAYPLTPPFLTVATQNPIEQEGTYPLPEAQLDRFLLKVAVGYPSVDDEIALVERVTHNNRGEVLDVTAVEQVSSLAEVQAAQRWVAGLVVDRRITEYAVAITRAAREWNALRVGPGPRGAIALIRSSRAHAVLEGRDFVIPDDVKQVAAPCLRHRMVLSPELEIDGYHPDQIIEEVLASVEAPRS
jgi:MoxR-like ATPase